MREKNIYSKYYTGELFTDYHNKQVGLHLS
jgi:hypothetical protein